MTYPLYIFYNICGCWLCGYDVCGYARSCRKSTLPDILRNLPRAEQKVGTALHNRPLCTTNKSAVPLLGKCFYVTNFRLSLLLSLRSTQNEPLQFLAKASKGNPLLLRNCWRIRRWHFGWQSVKVKRLPRAARYQHARQRWLWQRRWDQFR
jgi:hypothetical protein